MEIKIREVEEGLPVFIVDDREMTTVYDPGVLADLVTQIDDENNLTDLQQIAIDIVEFLLNNFGCITSQAMVKKIDSFTVNDEG